MASSDCPEQSVFFSTCSQVCAQQDSISRILTALVVQVMMSWNAMGYRTMGVVSGKVTVQHRHEISKISLANVNDHVKEMRLLGFLVMTNPLRTDSVAAIAELQKK